ncbi:hypothetical protein ACFL5V_07495 [Fibrobacterota bacterium]
MKIAFCLQHVAHKEKVAEYRERLFEKLPDDEDWFFSQLRKYRIHRELNSAMDLAYLAEIRFRDSRIIRPELNDIYQLSSQFFLAGRSYLHWLHLDKKKYTSVKLGLDNLLRIARIEVSSAELLDTLLSTVPLQSPLSFSVLEELCWIHKHYKGALAAHLGRLNLDNATWKDSERALQKMTAAGFYEFADLILKESSWREQKKPVYEEGLKYFLLIQYHQKNWRAIADENKRVKNWKDLSWENLFYLAAALSRIKYGSSDTIKSNRAFSSLIAGHLINQAPSPWDYKSVFIQVENLIAEGGYEKATELLIQEKTNPTRREGTGHILFWSAITALYQGNYSVADSLLVLATAYTNEEFTQRALKFRHWLIKDTSGVSRRSFFNGLDESPLSIHERRASIEQIPEKSPLWENGQLELARILWKTGRKDSALVILDALQARNGSGWTGLHAKAEANFMREKEQPLLKSLAIYDEILLIYRQGIIAEFSRERIRQIKSVLADRSGKK